MARRVEVQLVGDSRSLERAFDRSERKAREFDTAIGRTRTSLKGYAKAGAVGAAIAGTALLGRVLATSAQEAKEAQVAQAQLRQALKASGKSYKQYGTEIEDAITKTSKLAAIDDELVSDSFAKLLRTTGNVDKAMEGMALAADIVRARNMSLDSATKIVERTLNGQYLSLRRVGVQIDTNATSLEAIEKAQKKFAGSAEAYGKTAAGAQERFAVAVENLQEKIGTKLLPVLTKLAIKATEFIEWAERNWPRFQQKVEEMWAVVKPIFDAFRAYLDGWIKIVQGIIEGDWSLIWAGVKKAVVNGFRLVFQFLTAVPRKLFQLGLEMGQQLAAGVLEGIKSLPSKIFNTIIPGGPNTGGDKIAGGRIAQPKAAPATAGANKHLDRRASGGPVRPGKSYIVGERGPETLTMGRMGGMVSAATGGIYIGTVVLENVQNPQDLLAQLTRLSKRTAGQSRGRYGGQNVALA